MDKDWFDEAKMQTSMRELERRLKALPTEITGKNGGPLAQSLGLAAKVIQEQAAENAQNLKVFSKDGPYKRTGRLVDSVSRAKSKAPETLDGRPNEAYFIFPRPGKSRDDEKGAYYGGIIEYGSEHMEPRPYMRPAFESKKEEALVVFKTVLGRKITNIEKKGGNKGWSSGYAAAKGRA